MPGIFGLATMDMGLSTDPANQKNVSEKPILDDELVQACRREPQGRMGYTDTR